ncbi:hypothetical protein PIGHUM_02919 [Pigmentiphaga humi]|uniref:Uncharacterized protein n=1 Tax=Pigmentiphaga humi TaxID=2478468 RepID=A0A3P4B5A7_9BURK|nr:hypothetical protein [Pigmentiphaga humi]VCU70840.1 hypothetical protein PIGHUM_02919 [Pigmentiphaga humi]
MKPTKNSPEFHFRKVNFSLGNEALSCSAVLASLVQTVDKAEKENAPLAATCEALYVVRTQVNRNFPRMDANTQPLRRQGNVVFLPSFGQPKLKQQIWRQLRLAQRRAVVPLMYHWPVDRSPTFSGAMPRQA